MTLTALRYDPSSYDIQDDPFPVYRRMQDEQPLYRNDELGFWALTRFNDVLAGLTDHKSLSSAKGTLIESIKSEAPPPDMIIFQDPPRHDKLRKLVAKGFTPKRIGEMHQFVRELAVSWLDPMRDTGGGDIVEDFAAKLPMAVIAKLLGVPDEDQAWIRETSDRLLHRDEGDLNRPDDARAAGAEMFGYMADLVTSRRAQGRDDLATALVEASYVDDDGVTQRLDDMEIIFFCLLLGVAGNETTTKLITNVLVALHDHPDERTRLLADPSLYGDAVEEILRFDPPSHYQGRVTTVPMTWYGQEIAAGETVLLINGAANRDPRAFDDPDVYRLGRSTERHLGFGMGIHFCLGASLARLETKIALEEFLRRFPGYEIDRSSVKRGYSSNVRGLSRVVFSA